MLKRLILILWHFFSPYNERISMLEARVTKLEKVLGATQ